MDFFKVQFNEDIWTVYLIDNDDDVVSDLDAAAEVMFDQKEIYFRNNSLELWHVYFGYCYLDSAGISWHQAEEISASLFADKAQAILNKGFEVYKKLCDLRDSINDNN